jgi:hypothetical protein
VFRSWSTWATRFRRLVCCRCLHTWPPSRIFLAPTTAQHHPHPAATDGRLAWWQEGGGQAGMVGSHGCRLCRRQAVPPHSTHLAHPTVGAELSVVVDASATHVGMCLQLRLPGRKVWHPLGLFSKKLEVAQQTYSAFDRELFACYAGICYFRYMLGGRRFAIFTDHKPLTYALARVSEPWMARQSRQLSYVAKYTSDIRHITEAASRCRPPRMPAAPSVQPAPS